MATGIAFAVALYAVSEANSATYFQVVDNTTAGRFSASSKWISSNYSTQRYGANYRVLKKPGSTSANANYKIKTPAKASYRILARWPANSGYNNRARFNIKTSGGWKSKIVNQRKGGGQWALLGTYTLDAGDSYRVQVASRSSGTGYIVADAVKVVRATTASTADSGSSVTGAQVVAEAKRHIGKPYVYGAAGPNSFDCSGFTMYVYSKFGKSLPHNAASQYNYGRAVSGSGLKAGDLIFGRADGSPPGIQHVGIYDGNGGMIHAANPDWDVRRDDFPASWYNVAGYRRLVG